jgi:hypothetical protein
MGGGRERVVFVYIIPISLRVVGVRKISFDVYCAGFDINGIVFEM